MTDDWDLKGRNNCLGIRYTKDARVCHGIIEVATMFIVQHQNHCSRHQRHLVIIAVPLLYYDPPTQIDS